jgi:metallo-beta-lactamase class B
MDDAHDRVDRPRDRRSALAAGLILATLLVPGGAGAQVARIEILQIPSLTPTDAQFLTGASDAQPVTIGAELRLPPGGGRLPAVLLVHGSGGIGASLDLWARELAAMGIATLIVDSFTARGIVDTLNDQSQLGRLTMLVDSYRALGVLARHPRIDPARIAIMGFSRGGTPALYSSMRRFQKRYGPPGASFAAHIAFYASCNTTYIGDTDVGPEPIRLFHGTADDYVAVGPCRSYVARLKAAGKDVVLTEYPDAGHGFDNPMRTAPLVLPAAQTTRHCAFEESAAGTIVNQVTGRPFDWTDPCIEHGPTVAYQEKAHQESLKAVRAFLRDALDLPPPGWTEPFPPFRIAGNLYYVGSRDLASYLVTTPKGHVLINSDLEANVPLIRASVEKLGFKLEDVKILLISHAHFDHAAGSAALKKLTGAQYLVMDGDVAVVESGGQSDFQYGSKERFRYPAAQVDRVLHDGDEVKLGDSVLVAHATPGHTRGTTTWTMKVTEGNRTLDAVILGSAHVNDGYRLVNNPVYPRIADDFERTFRTLKSLPCDLFLGAHGSYFDLEAKAARLKDAAPNPFVDPEGYRTFVRDQEAAFRAEFARQKAAAR